MRLAQRQLLQRQRPQANDDRHERADQKDVMQRGGKGAPQRIAHGHEQGLSIRRRASQLLRERRRQHGTQPGSGVANQNHGSAGELIRHVARQPAGDLNTAAVPSECCRRSPRRSSGRWSGRTAPMSYRSEHAVWRRVLHVDRQDRKQAAGPSPTIAMLR